MTWHRRHPAQLLEDAEGMPGRGTRRTGRDAGASNDHPDPEHP